MRIVCVLVAETGQVQEECQTWRAKLEQEKTWTAFQVHYIKAQAYMRKRQKISRQRGYTSAVGVNIIVDICMAFTNMAHVTEEDCANVTKLRMVNI